MKPKLLLRIAAILIAIHGVGHTIGHSGWKNAPDPVERQVIGQMTGHKFPFMGAIHSLGDYFEGYGYACSIALLLIAILLWITAGELQANKTLAGKVILTISLGLVIWAVDEVIYFFPFAAAPTFLASLCGLLAYYSLRQNVKTT
jgi:hypothetical protein